MGLRTFQVGSPRRRGEGLRIGAVRFLPRGVRAADYARRAYFDVWLPCLAPSTALVRSVHQLPLTPQRFARFAARYAAEMRRNTDSRQVIRLVAQLASRTPIAVGCYCANESICHRSVLFRLLTEASRGKF